MSLFLFLKQIVDIFYKCKWMDYVLVAMAILILIKQLWLLRPNKMTKTYGNGAVIKHGSYRISILKPLKLPDICIIYFSISATVKLLAYHSINVEIYGKLMSAFVLYTIGRICKERILECTGYLALASYIVVYANVVYRWISLGSERFFTSRISEGGLYYFDTDLSYAMLLALIFISMYGKNGILKFLTIFLVIPFMVLHSGADIQKILMVVIYIILFIYMAERAVKRRRLSDYILPTALILLIVILIGILLPVFYGEKTSSVLYYIDKYITNTENIRERYSEWSNAKTIFLNSNLGWRLFGFGIEPIGSIINQYLYTLYNYGYVGIGLLTTFIGSCTWFAIKEDNRKTYYVAIMLAIVFLGSSIVLNGMDRTQMSWLVMMYAGMVVCKNELSEKRAYFCENNREITT